MSIECRLLERIQGGGLIPWEPMLPGDSCRRTLLLTEDLYASFNPDKWHDQGRAMRFARLAADFDRFATGEIIPVGWDPFDKFATALMARISPPEYGIWDIRSVAPEPQMRVLGAFASRDTFVGLQAYFREDLGSQRHWDTARENAIALWQSIMGEQPRLTGGVLDDYISEAAITV